MKKVTVLAAGILLLLVLAGCGPKGGTITLVNESTFTLGNAEISMGGGKETSLYPGQWMRSSHNKNIGGMRVKFDLLNGADKVHVLGINGSYGPLGLTWRSELVSVNDGAALVVTVRDGSMLASE